MHGHDIYALAILDTEHGLRFASGADETIIRVFDAPRNFVETMQKLNGCTLPDASQRPVGATIPPLGLSNRATSSGALMSALALEFI